MKLMYSHSKRYIIAGERLFPASCKVRNDDNGLRPRGQERDVVRTTNQDGSVGVPYMPQIFPIGQWRITGIIPHTRIGTDGKPIEPYLYPFFISTDAWQEVDEWELDKNKRYWRKTGNKVKDYAYGLHYSSSDTTTGCIKVEIQNDLRWIVDNVVSGDLFIVTE